MQRNVCLLNARDGIDDRGNNFFTVVFSGEERVKLYLIELGLLGLKAFTV